MRLIVCIASEIVLRVRSISWCDEAWYYCGDKNDAGDRGFCQTMCKDRWCTGGPEDSGSGSGSLVDAAEKYFYNLFYYSEVDDLEAMPRDLPRWDYSHPILRRNSEESDPLTRQETQ